MHSQKVSHRLGVPCLAGHERDCNQNQPRAYTRWKPDHHRGPEVLSIFSGAPNMLIILFITTISWDPVDSLSRWKKILLMEVLIKAKPKCVLNELHHVNRLISGNIGHSIPSWLLLSCIVFLIYCTFYCWPTYLIASYIARQGQI